MVLTLAVAVLAACSSEEVVERAPEVAPCDIEVAAVAPNMLAAAEERPFYPLEIGNRWVYRRELWQQIVVENEPPPDPSEATVMTERELTGFEEIAGVMYTVEEERTSGGALPGVELRWWRHRQDASGLYRRVMNSTVPPAVPVAVWGEVPEFLRTALADHEARVRAARAVLTSARTAEEVLRIAYPLEEGAMWMTTDDATGVLATAEAMETLDLEVGRVRGWPVRFEPNGSTAEDSLKTWYGSCGVLRSLIHLVTHAMDPGTGQTATITTREVGQLVELDLAGRK